LLSQWGWEKGGSKTIRAIVFDFDGVIVDTERIHFRILRDMVAGFGKSLSLEEYLERYLPFDDWNCIYSIFRDKGIKYDDIGRLVREKRRMFEEATAEGLDLIPGVRGFVEEAARRFPIAIASGASRDEIERILKAVGLRSFFKAIVGAEDTRKGKPDPEPYRKALRLINSLDPVPFPPISPEECLVVEDSIHGVRSAKSAGMRCLAIATSYSKEMLLEADLVVESFEGLSVDGLISAFTERGVL